mmetsp:Transcript_7628/g.10826  ORF Transcript_7628/g.10826 Transcript_7628/m.10826 type:complete len:138 (+) Transcript_7628:573-986(+)
MRCAPRTASFFSAAFGSVEELRKRLYLCITHGVCGEQDQFRNFPSFFLLHPTNTSSQIVLVEDIQRPATETSCGCRTDGRTDQVLALLPSAETCCGRCARRSSPSGWAAPWLRPMPATCCSRWARPSSIRQQTFAAD